MILREKDSPSIPVFCFFLYYMGDAWSCWRRQWRKVLLGSDLHPRPSVTSPGKKWNQLDFVLQIPMQQILIGFNNFIQWEELQITSYMQISYSDILLEYEKAVFFFKLLLLLSCFLFNGKSRSFPFIILASHALGFFLYRTLS